MPFLLIQPQQLPLPLKVQNFVGDAELYSLSAKKWFPIERGDVIGPRQRVRTGDGGELDLQIGEESYVRLTENTEVQIRRSNLLEKKPLLRLYLRKGGLFGVIPRSNSNLNLKVATHPPGNLFAERYLLRLFKP